VPVSGKGTVFDAANFTGLTAYRPLYLSGGSIPLSAEL
jgi:hypothetical protein